MISDIPDEVIDVDFDTIKELFTIPAPHLPVGSTLILYK